MDQRTAVLIGATGLVGGACIDELLKSDVYRQVIALVRRPLIRQNAKLVVNVSGFQDFSAISIPAGADLYCALGTTIRTAGSKEAFRQVDCELAHRFATRGAASGASQFVLVSSVGANSGSGNFYLRTKGELEDRLAALGFASLRIFRPGLLLGRRGEFRLGEACATPIMKVFGPLLVGGASKYRAVQASDLAKAMVASASLGDRGRFVYHYEEIQSLAQRSGR